jgi:hypothetical protein
MAVSGWPSLWRTWSKTILNMNGYKRVMLILMTGRSEKMLANMEAIFTGFQLPLDKDSFVDLSNRRPYFVVVHLGIMS